MLGAFRITQREKPTTQSVHETIARRVDRFFAVRNVIRRVVGDIDHDLVGLRADIRRRNRHVSVGTLLKKFPTVVRDKKNLPSPSFPKRGNLKITTLKKEDEG